MLASDFLRDLSARGRYHFTTEEAAQELGASMTAARSALRRLKRKGLIASPHRGFHVIVPPEFRRLGCLPAEQFIPQLMERLGIAYYAGLLTAARYHGAAHQQPQVFQVVAQKNRPAIQCGLVRVAFVARHNAGEMPTQLFNTPRGYVPVASPETTAFDLVGYADHCGGLDNVATVLVELAEKLDPEQLRSIARLSPLPWAQRLGFLLDRLGETSRTPALASYVSAAATGPVPLSPGSAHGPAERDKRWKIAVNVAVEPDL